ncbi:Serine protease [Stackebrandtia soli]
MTVKRTRWSAAIGVAATAAIAAATLGSTPAHADGTILGADNPDAIDGKYIVALDDSVSTRQADGLLGSFDAAITSTFASIDAYAVEMSEEDAKALAGDARVRYVEQDAVVSITGTQANPPSWGLDRIDQQDLPLDNSYTYPDSAGAGVTSYIIDTGADLDHPDFGGRMSSGWDTVDNDGDASDCQGHGTHVAGTIGGTAYGVAKAADLVAVRVLNCSGSGTYEGVIAGIDWVTGNAQHPATANMSLGGGFSQAVNDAVTASVASGVTYALAAGNESTSACTRSPASTPDALTVAASDSGDAHASFSNYAECVDLYAPGVSITSAWLNGGTNTISGTSMAAPHVAGAATLYLGEFPSATPAQVGDALVDNAVAGTLTGVPPNTPNLLLNIEFLNDGGGPGPGECAATNDAAVAIPDQSSITSTVSIDCEGAAVAGAVSVDITHTWRGDIGITLTSPGGTVHTLKESAIKDPDHDVKETYTVDLGAETASGDWTLTVTDAYYGDTGTLNGWTLDISDTPTEPGECAGADSTSVPLPDRAVISSTIAIGCEGVAATASVSVDITHTYRGDLVIKLTSPDGTVYTLKTSGADPADNVVETYSVDVSGQTASGDWVLTVEDVYNGDSGTFNGWSISL